MPQASELERLALRKRLLVAQIEIHRQSLALDCQQIEATTAWAPRAAGWIRTFAPVLIVAAPLAGFWLAGRRRSFGMLLQKGLIAWKLFQSLKPVIEHFRSPSRESTPP